jgi:sporulation integral membrane protein YlbJ
MALTNILLAIVVVLLFRVIYNRFFFSYKDILPRLLVGIGVVSFILIMITHPKIIFEGSVTGLNAWWNIVFPSLLPFFIASELLMSFGIVHFMGVLLEPVMRPLFNVPGSGSFVMAIGFTSGYPIGSMVTARLRSQGLCSRVEAERLMSFTNNSSPLFMLVAVAVGMFGNPAVGLVIAGAHYTANITLGLALRFYRRNDRKRTYQPHTGLQEIPAKALKEMVAVLKKENRPFGKIMGDAVKNSITNLLNIGGFIILFAVIIKLLTELGFIGLMSSLLGKILIPLGVSAGVLDAVASGFFEMTMGTKLASESGAPLLQQLVAVGIILAWSGLSVIAQVASMIAHTDLRLGPFIVSRIFHALLAGLYTVFFYHLLEPRLIVSSVFTWNIHTGWATTLIFIKNNILLFFSLLLFLIILSLLLLLINLLFRHIGRSR